jgi:hypothetical protein
MKPGEILSGALSEGSGVEGRSASKKEEPPASSGANQEPEVPVPPRKKNNFRGSGALHFHDGSDSDIFDSTRS